MKTKFTIIALLLLIISFIQTVAPADEAISEAKMIGIANDGTITILYGGDTVSCEFIGISMPGPENPINPASWRFSKELLENKTVRLEFDEQKRGEHGNMLAYVHCDDVFVNAELLRQGYASVMIVSPNIKHAEDFLKFEREAREARRGLWAEQNETETPIESAASLEAQIAIMKMKIDELSHKVEQLFQIIKELQSANVPSSARIQEPDKNDEKTDISQPDQIVYITRAGKKYHRKDCAHLKGRQYSEISIEAAERRGLQPCSVCFPEKVEKAKDNH